MGIMLETRSPDLFSRPGGTLKTSSANLRWLPCTSSTEASETIYQKAGIADPGRQRDEIYSQRLTSGSILYPF
jgi:hypothetical protein